MTKPYVLGIDPGFTGALALIDVPNAAVHLLDMPMTVRDARREIDLPALATFLDRYRGQIACALIEDVFCRPGEGVVSVFRFGYGAGALAGSVSAHFIPLYFTKPAVWKAVMGVTADKDTSLKKARELYPALELELARKKDHGRAEAILLAHLAAERIYRVLREVPDGAEAN